MQTDDTIAAISTPAGQGGIGIVRLSGKDAIKIADRIFRSSKKHRINKTRSHRILYGHILDPDSKELVDEVLISVMKAPRTFTREDIIEINCHGGAVSIRRVLQLVIDNGARLANPGEFTQRAFLNGRIDLAQAEAVLDVINSRTVESQKTAVNQLKGNLSGKIRKIREELIDLAALVETYIDFPEEDMEPLSLKDMHNRSLKISKALEKLIDSAKYGLILREGLRTAIVGRPNVGKSSLLNALVEKDRAIVTEAPGTTRDIIEEYLHIQGLPLRIMDTAGIRSVEDIAEKEGVRRSLSAIEDADLVLLVLDGSEPLHETDKELIDKSKNKKRIPVINKIDLSQKLKIDNLKKDSVKISAKNGTGLSRLKNKILTTALNGNTGSNTEAVTNIRHVHALEKTLASLHAFREEMHKRTSPEFLSVELREALDAVGEIIGITTPDDILKRIFSSFCIGK
jgi:tRNA modification GTPase